MRNTVAWFALVLVAACGGKVSLGPGEDGESAGGSGPGGGSTSKGGQVHGGNATGGNAIGGGYNLGGAPPGAGGGGAGAPQPGTCGGKACVAGEVCCHLKAQCMAISDAKGACPSAFSAMTSEPSCGSDADCAQGEYCEVHVACTGPGSCRAMSDCGWSSQDWCGCDGKTYDYHSACSAGIPAIDDAPCGSTSDSFGGAELTACGNSSSWCKGGQECCVITGYCYDPAKPLLCTVPPEGTYFPCITDADCPRAGDFCQGSTTCGGPGGCVMQAQPGQCTGEWAPVCGCDGKTYVNAVCASVQRVAVAQKGECP